MTKQEAYCWILIWMTRSWGWLTYQEKEVNNVRDKG